MSVPAPASQKQHHAFVGLNAPCGLIPAYRKLLIDYKFPANLKPQPWYKLHLTLLFWPLVKASDLQIIHTRLKDYVSKREINVKSVIQGFHFFMRPQVLYLRETSDEVIELQKDLAEFNRRSFQDIPAEEREESFTPHWSIGRKFHSAMMTDNTDFFKALDRFSLESYSPGICLYYSYGGRYEPLPFTGSIPGND